MTRKADAASVATEAYRLRTEHGLNFRQIGAELGLSHSGARAAVKRYYRLNGRTYPPQSRHATRSANPAPDSKIMKMLRDWGSTRAGL